MIEETCFFTLKTSDENAKITLRSKTVDNQTFYIANVVGIDLEYYKKLNNEKQQNCLGMEMSDGEGNTVYYEEKSRLKEDIIEFYGQKRLKSEI
jgi:hypothetical protein